MDRYSFDVENSHLLLHAGLPALSKIAGKTTTRTLTPDQAQRYEPWFNNARQLRALSTELEALSLQIATQAEGWGKK